MGRFKRAVAMSWWLMKALILKLSPVRRLMLIVSIWLILMGDLSFSYSAADVNMSFHFSKVGYLVLLVVLMLELKDKVLARDELAVGRAVQLALMPCESPDIAGWDVWLYTRPANDVGGDLVDFLPLQNGAAGLTLGDVSGKGLGAALLMAKLQATLRAYAVDAEGEGALADMGGRVNRVLCRDGLANRFATLLILRAEPDSGRVRFMNAGHMPPLVLSAGEVKRHPPVAPLLGVLPDARFAEQEVDLTAGDLLVAYSDGLTEAMNGAEDFFSEERLLALMPSLAGLEAKEAGRRLISAVDAFIGEERPSDDLSLILLKRSPGGLPDDPCGPIPGTGGGTET
jgi:sigma-B regulation protein RsbU (phosphoserine phosphatase)